MPRFAVVADDYTRDSMEDPFYGAEVVECDDERDALGLSEEFRDMNFAFRTFRVVDDTPLGYYDALAELNPYIEES